MKRILWFRRDLRITDNALLSYDGEVLPIFIFDTFILEKLRAEDKRISLIFHLLTRLKRELKTLGLDLLIFHGDPIEVFEFLKPELFDEVVASGDYDGYARKRDIKIAQMLHFRYINDTYLFEPYKILKADQTPYLLFTPFYNKALKFLEDRCQKAHKIGNHTLYDMNCDNIVRIKKTDASFLPFSIDSIGFQDQSVPFTQPYEKLELFVQKLKDYALMRDYFAEEACSSLSVDLRFGTISIREVLRRIRGLQGSSAFVRQLIFRDFYAYLLFHFPHIEQCNFKYAFNGIEDNLRYELFCNAKTGVPIIDAGIRELLQTGKMPNRVRMIVASFFTKDLLLPWQWGADFFADKLLDFDAATNILSWQWCAGTGVDPQPYFRIFNPYLQAKRFDKEAYYIKKWLPELAHLEAHNIHDETFLATHNIKDYPHAIINHREASKVALNHFKSHK